MSDLAPVVNKLSSTAKDLLTQIEIVRQFPKTLTDEELDSVLLDLVKTSKATTEVYQTLRPEGLARECLQHFENRPSAGKRYFPQPLTAVRALTAAFGVSIEELINDGIIVCDIKKFEELIQKQCAYSDDPADELERLLALLNKYTAREKEYRRLLLKQTTNENNEKKEETNVTPETSDN